MTVDWATRVVTIPQEDLTFVSGTLYTSDTNDLRILIKEEEASVIGMVFPDIARHNTEVGPIVGTIYARTIEIINGYSLTFSPDSAWSVQLEGSNNNMWDVGGGILNQNQVQVIPTNSSGLIVRSTGSGLSSEEQTRLIAIKSKTDNLPDNPSSVSDIPTAADNTDAIWQEVLDGADQAKEILLDARKKAKLAAFKL